VVFLLVHSLSSCEARRNIRASVGANRLSLDATNYRRRGVSERSVFTLMSTVATKIEGIHLARSSILRCEPARLLLVEKE